MESGVDGDSQAKESRDGAGDVEGNLHENRRLACNYSLRFTESAEISRRMLICCNVHVGKENVVHLKRSHSSWGFVYTYILPMEMVRVGPEPIPVVTITIDTI